MTFEPFLAAAERLEDVVPQLRKGLAQLFADAQDLIDGRQVSLVVLMDRRLGCLYQALVRAGMPRLTGCDVVGDRYFDTNPEREWANERVLILDDTVVVGTTLERFLTRLQSDMGPGQVRATAVVLDAEQHVPFLTEKLRLEPLFRKTTAEVDAFSQSIVRTLFRFQVPYFSDFAGTEPMQMDAATWQAVVSSDRWYVVDVSNPLVADDTRRAFSLIPTDETQRAIVQGVSGPIRNLVEQIKYRIYLRWEGEQATVTMVPLALLGPCSHTRLRTSIQAMDRCHPALGDLNVQTWKPEAVQRLLQMLASMQSLKVLWAALRDEGARTAELDAGSFATLPLELSFGERCSAVRRVMDSALEDPCDAEKLDPPPPGLQPTPSKLLDRDEVRDALWRARETLARIPPPPTPTPGVPIRLDDLFSHAVLEAFGWVHATVEKQQRERIAAYESLADYQTAFEDPDERILHHGLTARELTTELLPHALGGSAWDRAQILLGVDVGNDLGIVVPTTRHDKRRDVVYRTYRLGETAHLVDTPLWRLVDEDSPEPDAFTEEASRGSAAADLASRAFPGAVVSRYDGVVTAVDATHFTAVLTDPISGDDVPAELALNQLSEADQSRLVPGRRFVWTVFQKEDLAGRTRTSRMRLLAEPPLDGADLVGAANG